MTDWRHVAEATIAARIAKGLAAAYADRSASVEMIAAVASAESGAAAQIDAAERAILAMESSRPIERFTDIPNQEIER